MWAKPTRSFPYPHPGPGAQAKVLPPSAVPVNVTDCPLHMKGAVGVSDGNMESRMANVSDTPKLAGQPGLSNDSITVSVPSSRPSAVALRVNEADCCDAGMVMVLGLLVPVGPMAG